MPELPEVETIKNALIKGIGQARILDVIVYNRRFRMTVPDDFKERILNATILSYQRIAKYIVINLDNGISIIWHLGMSGRIKIVQNIPKKNEKHDHVILSTDKGCLIFNDARRFGLITYCLTSCLDKFPPFAKSGTDPFSDTMTPLYLFNRLHNKKIPVKQALLDQSVIAGIGNIYASEILYDAGISPLRESASLSRNDCRKVVESVRKILQKAIDAGGSTLKDYHKPDGSEGYFQFAHCVYNKTGQPCPNCTCQIQKTGGIQKIVQGGRSTFYCATKQK